MTDDKPMGRTDHDALVSRTYAELADERAPQHLNDAVLRAAGAAERPRFLRLASWARPLAWAATVALSIALVLEVTTVPTPETATFDGSEDKFKAPRSAPAANGRSTDFTIGDADMLRRADEMARLQNGEDKEAALASSAANIAAEVPEYRDEDDSAAACDEVARATAIAWSDCIDDLEQAGLTNQADLQRKALQQTFPDFAGR